MNNDIQISEEMLDFMLISHPYHKKVYYNAGKPFIGHHHRLKWVSEAEQLDKPEALDLFYEDVRKTENYILIKKLKNKIPKYLYDVCVHFTFDYGTNTLKNSKIYLYFQQQDADKIIEELRNYKTRLNKINKGSVKRRNFDISVIENKGYNFKEIKNGHKKRIPRKNAGFRY